MRWKTPITPRTPRVPDCHVARLPKGCLLTASSCQLPFGRSRPRPVSKFLSGPAYLQALEAIADVIGWLVTENLLEKHIEPVFITDSL